MNKHIKWWYIGVIANTSQCYIQSIKSAIETQWLTCAISFALATFVMLFGLKVHKIIKHNQDGNI